MALADYRLCDVCGGKAFYDANLNYDTDASDPRPPFRTAGREQIENSKLQKHGYRIDNLGDWAVLCRHCAQSHRTMIVPRTETANTGSVS